MELPSRAADDQLLKPGEYRDLRARLRKVAHSHDLVTVVACAFDHRTRILPFIGADLRMASAGVRAIGAAMVDSGFPQTRIVQQQWNPHFSPSRMKLDGRVPDLFLVSSMSVHSACGKNLVADACRIDPAHRPLIVAGGPRSVYEPWDALRTHVDEPEGADLVVTGEEFVWMSFLERLLAERARGESVRDTFLRARDRGRFDDIPGLCYARTDREGVAEEIVDTGVQRLLADLDELPHPVIGYRLLERPGRSRTLAARPMPERLVRKYSPIASLVLTYGCKF
ncbi:MAG: radical SAM protein, partial [Planctomycetota bacterium]